PAARRHASRPSPSNHHEPARTLWAWPIRANSQGPLDCNGPRFACAQRGQPRSYRPAPVIDMRQVRTSWCNAAERIVLLICWREGNSLRHSIPLMSRATPVSLDIYRTLSDPAVRCARRDVGYATGSSPLVTLCLAAVVVIAPYGVEFPLGPTW